jgi:Ca-activated chloride channel family protein
MTLTLAWPLVLLALPLPLLAAWLLPQTPQRARLLLATAGWLLLVMAAARPQSIGEPLQLPVSGRDLLLAVDISGSMETPDMQLGRQVTDRLTAVKAVAGEFIGRREGDRLGLILFGEQAYLQTPLTFDRQTVRTLLNEAAIGLAGKSTAIGDAIGLAVKRLRQQPQANHVLILLTDGANTAGSVDPLKAADLAAAQGLRIYTIGVGAESIRVRGLLGTRQVSNTELDEATLTAIAEKTGGRYFRARDIAGLEAIYQLLDELEPASQDAEVFRPVRELYAWPLAGALLISVLLALAASGLVMPGRVREARHA